MGSNNCSDDAQQPFYCVAVFPVFSMWFGLYFHVIPIYIDSVNHMFSKTMITLCVTHKIKSLLNYLKYSF